MALLALMGPLFFVYLFSGTLPVNSSFDAWLSTIYLVNWLILIKKKPETFTKLSEKKIFIVFTLWKNESSMNRDSYSSRASLMLGSYLYY